MSLLFKGRETDFKPRGHSAVTRFYFAILNTFRQGVQSLGEMWRTPGASLLTMFVLGLSLTLPSTLYLIVKNVQTVSDGFNEAAEISLFVKADATAQETQSLVKRLALFDEINSVRHINKEAALKEFKQVSGFAQALDYLDENPLPDVIVVTPTSRYRAPALAKQLLVKLQNEREVEYGKLDIQWLERLDALLSLLKESVVTIGVLLLSAVMLIIGNTIRLSIMDKRSEIQVMKLVGATNGFIQAPFLWTGIWYGVVGGIIALIANLLMMWWLESAVATVTGLYQSDFTLQSLDVDEFAILVGLAIVLGFVGSYLSVRRHINDIEPDKV